MQNNSLTMETNSPDLTEALDTPMMRQYLEIKAKFPDSILFFRMGDFYEMFLEDAKIASAILDIALTKRQNSVPMCGIPFHSKDGYISRLLTAGKKIAVCEQSRPEDGNTKLMTRDVVRIITPGTVIEEHLLSGFQNNYLCVLVPKAALIFVGMADVSTGEVLHFAVPISRTHVLESEFVKFKPSEICVFSQDLERIRTWQNFGERELTVLDATKIGSENSNDPFQTVTRTLEYYIRENYRDGTLTLREPRILQTGSYLEMDRETILNLELIENEKEDKGHTLFSVLNFCSTAKGKRVLKQRILFPETDPAILKSRWEKQDIIKKIPLAHLTQALKDLGDLERILGRFRGNKAYPRDFKTILSSIQTLDSLIGLLSPLGYPISKPDKLDQLKDYIEGRIHTEELPVILGNGKFLKDGFDKNLDRAREAGSKGADWILELETEEKKKTGLSTLKIKYNKIVGYFIEISRAQAEQAPKEYLKKQTLVTYERFTTARLEEIERTILEADEIIQKVEKAEFEKMVQAVLEYSSELLLVSEEFGDLDFQISLLKAEEKFGWIRPELSEDSNLEMKSSRHPVVEASLPVGAKFTPNDVGLDGKENSIAILTGPNMAGKSTFMRQIAINQILFQIGGSVAAEAAKLPILDKLFTRIGAGDNLNAGESTFYVEMKETANILKNCTSQSLLLFDEVGRGTSTYDGMSIAWAILESLSEMYPRPKTVFATHYHELTELSRLPGVWNLHMETVEKDDKVIFLRKVKPGKAKKSFGIYVAQLAGVPDSVVKRAAEILTDMESRKKEIRIQTREPSLFQDMSAPNGDSQFWQDFKKEINDLPIDSMTPIEALKLLDDWKKRVSSRG
ncbi:DNA mismatch repair protein MutS [Leptospira selangorensis]|uniref:DNA mismatch repair protein MutS n=1 Tax=Leptospira selangorensis TaxID=2484982 RepID=A0A5F2C3L9_9LEPT|nr:DNA mismatch repair protein MutS [Leptospira selangorensis]TGM11295.1 DNA mismatch repair protein MutS [Leptospira selangorensis]TGM22953.1 DNA mismatch repair protein MutS [Leptospira selangorensis]